MKINVEGIEIDFSDKLIEVLKAEPDNAYERFIKNFSLHWKNELAFMKQFENSINYFGGVSLASAFVWSKTPEKFTYWSKISLKML